MRVVAGETFAVRATGVVGVPEGVGEVSGGPVQGVDEVEPHALRGGVVMGEEVGEVVDDGGEVGPEGGEEGWGAFFKADGC